MKSSQPLLTVLMPVFNADKYLREAIESILGQTFSDFEFLIVDDHSTDSSKEIIADYAKNDSRIKFLHNDFNMGLVKTLNRGLSFVTTPLLARQDADDISKLDRFEKQVRYLNTNSNVALLGTSFELLTPEGALKPFLLPTENSQIREFFRAGNCFAHGSIMLRTDDFKKLGGYSTETQADHIEDYEAWSRMMALYKVANIPDVLYTYRQHDESISSRHQSRQTENATRLGEKLLLKSAVVPSPFLYSFSKSRDPHALLRRDQNMLVLFEVTKRLWKSDQKPAAVFRWLFLSMTQPKFAFKTLRDYVRSVK